MLPRSLRDRPAAWPQSSALPEPGSFPQPVATSPMPPHRAPAPNAGTPRSASAPHVPPAPRPRVAPASVAGRLQRRDRSQEQPHRLVRRWRPQSRRGGCRCRSRAVCRTPTARGLDSPARDDTLHHPHRAGKAARAQFLPQHRRIATAGIPSCLQVGGGDRSGAQLRPAGGHSGKVPAFTYLRAVGRDNRSCVLIAISDQPC
jgi:hypothetical protein